MTTSTLHWPRTGPLGILLQSPAHRVMRVLHVTQSNWQVPERRRLAAQASAATGLIAAGCPA